MKKSKLVFLVAVLLTLFAVPALAQDGEGEGGGGANLGLLGRPSGSASPRPAARSVRVGRQARPAPGWRATRAPVAAFRSC